MHRTDTLDVITILRGETYLILDGDEILRKPTDTVITQGTAGAIAATSAAWLSA
jgi:uncharacterized protein with PhoU and TrkA domain